MRICSIFCNISYHVRQQGILNVAVWANHGVCAWDYLFIDFTSCYFLKIFFEVVPTDDRSCSWLQHLCPRPVSKLPTLKLSWRGHTLIHFNGCQHLLCQRTSLSDSKKWWTQRPRHPKEARAPAQYDEQKYSCTDKVGSVLYAVKVYQYPCVWSSSAIISKHTHIYIYNGYMYIYIHIYIW